MRAVEKAYLALREAIFTRRYVSGEQITEQEAVRLAGVSRTPVREALRRLQLEGVLDRKPNQASVVTNWTREDAEEVFELRLVLECYAIRLAADNVSRVQLAHMRELVSQQQELLEKPELDVDEVARLNNGFHKTLYHAGGNQRLASILMGLIEPTLVLRVFQHYSRNALVRSVQQHQEMVDALEVHKVEEAEAIMRLHVLAGRHEYRMGA